MPENNQKVHQKSFEELTYELLAYKEDMERAIRDYEESVKNMKRKDRSWTFVTLGIMVLVGITLFTSIGGFKIILDHPDEVRPILLACVGCLLLGFVVAHWLARWEHRADFNEDIMRHRREMAETKYADLLEQVEYLKSQKAKQKK